MLLRQFGLFLNHRRGRDGIGDTGAAADQLGKPGVERAWPPMMGAEDFSFMLNERPGAFIWVGNGDSAALHNQSYNFNDEAIPFGTSYWVKLVETALPA